MSKRNKIIVETDESKALARMREISGLSLRKLGAKMGLSMTRVHQYEIGKEDVDEVYIKKFLNATNISVDKWNDELGRPSEMYELRKRCIDKLSLIEESKLELVYALLSNF